MGYVLALISALVFGCADFCGGRATRNASAAAVTFVSQAAGLVVLGVGVLFVNGKGPSVQVLGWGAVSGLAGAAGILLLYRALAIGVMSIVSPVTAVVAAAVPVLYGVLVDDERPSNEAIFGIVLALIAIVLVSMSNSSTEATAQRRSDVAVIALALGAGLGFGFFFVFLKQAGKPSDVGLWALVGARPVSMLVALVVAVRNARKAGGNENGRAAGGISVALRLPRAALPIVVAAGCLDQLANVLYALSLGRGLFAVIGVLAALYPVSTVALALAIDRERLRPVQIVGLVAAFAGTIAIAAGG